VPQQIEYRQSPLVTDGDFATAIGQELTWSAAAAAATAG
jgi:hypothetical protein